MVFFKAKQKVAFFVFGYYLIDWSVWKNSESEINEYNKRKPLVYSDIKSEFWLFQPLFKDSLMDKKSCSFYIVFL